jgi:UDP-N-acetylglucosamine:LPS N-acetylglucosamine transferase
MRITPAFEGFDVAYATVSRTYATQVPGHRFYAVGDCTRWDRLKMLATLLRVLWVVLRERPDVVVSTGALPGYMAVRLGKWLGARTVWLDSIANAQELSLAGQKIGPHADYWLTQWPELARPQGPHYAGCVL